MTNSNVIQLFKASAAPSDKKDEYMDDEQNCDFPADCRGVLANYFRYPDSHDMVFFIADRKHRYSGFYRVPMATFYNSAISPGDLTQQLPIDFRTTPDHDGESVTHPNGNSYVLRGSISFFVRPENNMAARPVF